MSLPLDRNVPAEAPEKQKCLLANRQDTIPRGVLGAVFRAGGLFHHHRFSERVLTNVFCSSIPDFSPRKIFPEPVKRVSDYLSPAIQAGRSAHRGWDNWMPIIIMDS